MKLNFITAENRAKLGKNLSKYLPVFSGDVNPIVDKVNTVGDKYIASLTQSGGNPPVATVIANNTGVSFTYFYLYPGIYGILASKDIFTDYVKTQVSISNASYIYDSAAQDGYSISVFPVDVNAVIILTSDLAGETDGILGDGIQNLLEITMYS